MLDTSCYHRVAMKVDSIPSKPQRRRSLGDDDMNKEWTKGMSQMENRSTPRRSRSSPSESSVRRTTKEAYLQSLCEVEKVKKPTTPRIEKTRSAFSTTCRRKSLASSTKNYPSRSFSDVLLDILPTIEEYHPGTRFREDNELRASSCHEMGRRRRRRSASSPSDNTSLSFSCHDLGRGNRRTNNNDIGTRPSKTPNTTSIRYKDSEKNDERTACVDFPIDTFDLSDSSTLSFEFEDDESSVTSFLPGDITQQDDTSCTILKDRFHTALSCSPSVTMKQRLIRQRRQELQTNLPHIPQRLLSPHADSELKKNNSKQRFQHHSENIRGSDHDEDGVVCLPFGLLVL
mmetsp:Transcript_22674/g.39828  ORF Transcript_22674/g.39828 Transcript_22674/m.39828 type:complete len:344 (+) Transcript_22674:51-1082(+)